MKILFAASEALLLLHPADWQMWPVPCQVHSVKMKRWTAVLLCHCTAALNRKSETK